MTDLSASWGRFSAKGSDSFEKRMTEMVKAISTRLSKIIPQKSYISLVLLGGYGRGEGGVLIENNDEMPHNNLDLMLLTHGLDNQESNTLQQSIEKELESIRKEITEVQVDLSLIPAKKLQNASGLMI